MTLVSAYGHGGDPYDEDTLDFENMQVTVSTRVYPSDISVDNLDGAQFVVNFFDNSTRENFRHVTYNLAIYKHDSLLARNYFYAENGTLTVDIRPVSECGHGNLWQCTTYYGTPHPINGALYTHGSSNPVIQGPLMYQGGLFHFQIEVSGAEFPNRVPAEPPVFDTYVSVAKEQTFYIDYP